MFTRSGTRGPRGAATGGVDRGLRIPTSAVDRPAPLAIAGCVHKREECCSKTEAFVEDTFTYRSVHEESGLVDNSVEVVPVVAHERDELHRNVSTRMRHVPSRGGEVVAPLEVEDTSTERAGDIGRAVGRARVDHDDLADDIKNRGEAAPMRGASSRAIRQAETIMM